MSAKVTVVLFILICFEIGGLLVFLPWHRSWNDNNLLYWLTETLDAPWLARAILSPYARGLVTGFGLVNVLIGVWEILNFRATVKKLGAPDAPVPDR